MFGCDNGFLPSILNLDIHFTLQVGYGYHKETKCDSIPKKSCHDVSKKIPSSHPKKKCNSKPKKRCHQVPEQVFILSDAYRISGKKRCRIQAPICALIGGFICASKLVCVLICALKVICVLVCALKLFCALVCVLVCALKLVCALVRAPKLISALVSAPKLIYALVPGSMVSMV